MSNDEDKEFAAWLRTLDRLPAEIEGREGWNAHVIMDAIDKIEALTAPKTEK